MQVEKKLPKIGHAISTASSCYHTTPSPPAAPQTAARLRCPGRAAAHAPAAVHGGAVQAVTGQLDASARQEHPNGMPAAVTSMLSGNTPALLAAAHQPCWWQQISRPCPPPHLLLQLPDAAHAVPQKSARILHMRNVVRVTAGLAGKYAAGHEGTQRLKCKQSRAPAKLLGLRDGSTTQQQRAAAQTAPASQRTRGRSGSSAPWLGSCRQEGWAAPCAASRRPGSSPARWAPACKGGGSVGKGVLLLQQQASWEAGRLNAAHLSLLTSLLCALLTGTAVRRPWRCGR